MNDRNLMRILFVSSSSGSRGGGELYLIYLGKELANRGYSVGLWCSQHPIMDGLAVAFGRFGEVLRSPYVNTYDRKLRSFSDIFPPYHNACISEWQAFQPQIIHLNKQNLEDGLDLLTWCDSLQIPRLITIHITQTQSSLGAFLGKLRDKIAKRALNNFSGSLLAISENRGQELKKLLPFSLHKITVIENGVCIPEDKERLTKRKIARVQLAINSDELLILAVGRMEAQKQPLLFLQWATHLKRNIPNARFLWVGDGRLTPIWEQWLKEYNAQDYIQRLEWQNDVTPFLAAADGFFHPAQFEGLPFALLEAMAWSLPCMISSSLADELKFPPEVYFVASGKDTLTGLDAFVNPSLRDAVASAGYQLIKDRFSLEKMVDTYESLYQRLTQTMSGE